MDTYENRPDIFGTESTMSDAFSEKSHKPMDLRRTQEIFDKGLDGRTERMLFRIEEALRKGQGA